MNANLRFALGCPLLLDDLLDGLLLHRPPRYGLVVRLGDHAAWDQQPVERPFPALDRKGAVSTGQHYAAAQPAVAAAWQDGAGHTSQHEYPPGHVEAKA